jgi:hypothetical protein
MRNGSRRTIVALLLVFLMAASGLTGMLGSAGDDGALAGGPGLFDTSPWVDDFDDRSRVNTTIGTEVVAGQVQLQTGNANGLVASVAISAPVGYRYDILILEVDTPGSSSVKVSVLNATEESTKVGYVNEPVPGFLKVDKTQVPLSGVGTKSFPQIRLQADLESAGTDKPALLKWTLHFVAEDMWRDEFWGDGKVDDRSRAVFDGEYAMVDMSMGNLYITGYDDHDDYPTIVTNDRGSVQQGQNRLNMGVFYTNAAGNGYRGRTQMYAENPEGFVAGDLDDDGYMDMVVANWRNGGDYSRNSWVLWGDASGTWDVARRTDLATDAGREPALGDVNGDGDLDILIVNGGGSGQVRIWINPGNRTYNLVHDMALTGADITAVAAADLDSDGYDDVVLAENYDTGSGYFSRLYYSSPSGPDDVADQSFETGDCQDVALGDFNGDGWIDIAFANTIVIGGNDRAATFYGSASGYDPTNAAMRFYADVPDDLATIAAGDINGDGYDDWVIGRSMQQPRMYVFWGAASGLSNARSDDPRIATSSLDNIVIDMNNDGFDDVISGSYWSDRIDIYNGGAGGIDGTRDMDMDTNNPTAIGVAVGRAKLTSLRGSFVSNVINRPLDEKWDILVLEGNFPAATDMEVSILDTGKQPILGYSGLKGPDIDLSGVTIPGIHIQVTLISNDLVTTPQLDRMFVKWMPANVWRDQFYGYAKVDRASGLNIVGGQMVPDPALSGGPEIVFSNLRDDGSYQVHSMAYRDAGGMDYTSVDPLRFRVPSGASDVVVADANGDGYADVLFPVLQTSSSNYIADSPLFMGSPTGFDTVPTTKFPTIGARDAVVADLNKDGHMDVVFAQEQNAGDYTVNSTLFWGDEDGWGSKPDVEFDTSGASGVVAADFDNDGLVDLAFACFRNQLTTSIDSLVFRQTATGFDGGSPDDSLPTKGARGVAVGDIDGNGWKDLVFANSISGGFVDIDSSVYWDDSGSTFHPTPTQLPTRGAEAVMVTDLNGDAKQDIVFANNMDNDQNRIVDSYVYIGTGSRTLSGTADVTVPTIGAQAVTVADLDGTGWKDLVFGCHYDGATYDMNSRVFLGGGSGYGSTPDLELATHGASGVAVVDLIPKDKGGYLSQVISPDNPIDAGVFETFRYDAVNLPAGHTGTIFVLDANTGSVLATTALLAGVNEWSLADKFRIREHAAIQILITVDGVDPRGILTIDDLWLNWSPRNRAPPRVLGLDLSATSVLRTQSITATINVTDEYDFLDEMTVKLEHRRSGTTDPWTAFMVSGLGYVDDQWTAHLNPRVDIPVGVYDLRAMVTDTDGMDSGWVVFPDMFEVLNNMPTAPEVQILPSRAIVTSALDVDIVVSAYDIESTQITYEYTWFLNGVLVPEITTSHVGSSWLERGQNWTVEVRANDTDDLGPAAIAWKLISNAPPFPSEDLPDPAIEEDTEDSDWLVLADAFDDPDGDILLWRVDPIPSFVLVDIDPETGRVTLMPIENWHGSETITFVASDGEFEANQTVTVYVTPVNDIPVWVTVNGDPYDGETIELEALQDEMLVINVLAFDVESDDLLFRVSDTQVILNLTTGQLRYTPDNDDIGWLNFTLTVNDNVETSKKITATFSVRITNVNDIMEDPRIISPSENDAYRWNESVGLRGVCIDPDEQWGQELNFSWSSNQSGLLGYGPSINYRFIKSGRHTITLTVSDGEYEKTTLINVSVGNEPEPPPPPPPPDEEGIPMWMIILAVLVAVGAVVGLMVVMRRKQPEPEPLPAISPEEQKRKDLEDFRDAVAATATAMEAERNADRAEKEEASIEVAGTGMVPSAQASHKMRLSEKASDETAKLWADMEKTETVVDDTEKEELAKENRKRKIQSAIQALPYGIPAPALRHITPDKLAEEMVDAATHDLPDGTQLVAIRGSWYHGDPEDSSKFLTPYKKKGESPASDSKSEWEAE